MKLLLLQMVKGLGDAGKTIDVKPGYAINHLIPNKLATTDLTTKVAIKEQKLSPEQIQGLVRKISKLRISISKRANDKGVLFSAVSDIDIINSIMQKISAPLAKLEVKLKEHIKTPGSYRLPVSINGAASEVKVQVIGERMPK